MARNEHRINKDISIFYGPDHALGAFVQVSDNRYEDEMGENWVFQWDRAFRTTTNKIGLNHNAVLKAMKDKEAKNVLINHCNHFIKTHDKPKEK